MSRLLHSQPWRCGFLLRQDLGFELLGLTFVSGYIECIRQHARIRFGRRPAASRRVLHLRARSLDSGAPEINGEEGGTMQIAVTYMLLDILKNVLQY